MFDFWTVIIVVAILWLSIGVAIDRSEVSQRERNRVFNANNYSRGIGIFVAVMCAVFWPWRILINKLNGEHPFT